MKYEIMEKPYTEEELKKIANEDGAVEGIVAVGLNNVLETDFEGFLDIVSSLLIGNVLLQDISYKVVGCDSDDNTLHLKISGYLPD